MNGTDWKEESRRARGKAVALLLLQIVVLAITMYAITNDGLRAVIATLGLMMFLAWGTEAERYSRAAEVYESEARADDKRRKQ